MAKKDNSDQTEVKRDHLLARLAKYLAKRKKRFVVIILLLLGIGWWTWSSQNTPVMVDLVTIEKGNVTESVSASGEVVAHESVTLTFQTSGKLAYVGVSEGDNVKKGQVIAYLDKKQLEATLKKYLNSFEREFTEFDDSNEDVKDSVLTDAVRRLKSRAQIDLNQTVIDVDIQNEAIRLATLYSPIKGIVTSVNPKFAGTNVGPTSASFEIVNPETVYFEAKINEVDISKVKEDLPVELTLDAYSDEVLQEKVDSISFSSTTTSTGATAYIAKISLPSNDAIKYRLGMNGDSKIILSQKSDVLLAPQTSVVEIDDKTYIWIIQDGLSKRVEVETGISSINDIEITSGVTEGTQIINRPPSTLKEGVKVASQTTK